MSRIFFISDTHFSHEAICKFTRADGIKLRPWDNVEEMNQALIDNWNRVVNNRDIVYHLGDVAMKEQGVHILGQLKGRKILVKGNHDKYKLKLYASYFEDILGVKVFQYHKFKAILSHIPLHFNHFRFNCYNIHGHLHEKNVITTYPTCPWYDTICLDTRYINVSVEKINYTPILVDKLVELCGEN